MAKVNVSLDATMLSSLQACARAHKNKFQLKRHPIGGKSNALECGTLVHLILEHYNKALIDGKSKADAMQIGFEEGKKYVPEMKNTPEIGDSRIVGWQHVFGTMLQYFDYYKNDSWNVLVSEETKGRIIYEDEEIRILWKAKFDCIVETNAGMTSMDHKTMKQSRDTNLMSNQFMGQCVLLNTRNVIINKIGFQKSLSPEQKFQRVIANYSTDRLAEWNFEILPYYAKKLVDYNNADYFPPNFTHCENKYGKCEYYRVCELDRNLRTHELLVNFEEGEEWDV